MSLLMKIKKQFILAMLFVGAGILGIFYVMRYPTFFWGRGRQTSAIVSIPARAVDVRTELARDPYTWSKGLMFRESLDRNTGMLFVFPDSAKRSFWMKNTLIPLDILFIDADKKIVTIHAGVMPCTTLSCPRYTSTMSARYVLEVNAGFVEQYGIHEGDAVEITVQ